LAQIIRINLFFTIFLIDTFQLKDKTTYQPIKDSTAQSDSTFKTVKIGEQTWMLPNLNIDHYRNGDPIPEVQDQLQWKNLKTGVWCYFDNDPENGKKYGKLYNWYAVTDPRGLAPGGWHISTVDEFDTLEHRVNLSGNALKAIGQGKGTNTSGFSALMVGYRNWFGPWHGFGQDPQFWTVNEGLPAVGYYLWLSYTTVDTFCLCSFHKRCGMSIRCVKD
jgi:uncharacterized protein (TIGR02145 family)